MTDRISSGFSFLSSKGAHTDNTEIETTDYNIEKSIKLTNTLDLSADNYESSMLGLPISMPQDIKIFKSSAAKFVSTFSTHIMLCFFTPLYLNSSHQSW